MKIHWGRILNAGLIAEIFFVTIWPFILPSDASRPVMAIFVISGSLVFMLVGALWATRILESNFILHGFLVGVVAIAYYIIRTLPSFINGEYQGNYWISALVGHPPKILGGMIGGYIASKIKK
ncbi:TIGR04086 family membrane protein [Thermodesulfobacteriota bacterium]